MHRRAGTAGAGPAVGRGAAAHRDGDDDDGHGHTNVSSVGSHCGGSARPQGHTATRRTQNPRGVAVGCHAPPTPGAWWSWGAGPRSPVRGWGPGQGVLAQRVAVTSGRLRCAWPAAVTTRGEDARCTHAHVSRGGAARWREREAGANQPPGTRAPHIRAGGLLCARTRGSRLPERGSGPAAPPAASWAPRGGWLPRPQNPSSSLHTGEGCSAPGPGEGRSRPGPVRGGADSGIELGAVC